MDSLQDHRVLAGADDQHARLVVVPAEEAADLLGGQEVVDLDRPGIAGGAFLAGVMGELGFALDDQRGLAEAFGQPIEGGDVVIAEGDDRRRNCRGRFPSFLCRGALAE